MKLSQINPNSLRAVSDREVTALHFRLHELAAPFLKSKLYDDARFLNIARKHRIVGAEMIRRGLRFKISDELDELAHPDVTPFIEVFAKLIPERLNELTKIELIKLHNQLHSVWEIIHVSHELGVRQQEQLWNWHKLIINALERRDIQHPEGWDSLDRPLGNTLAANNRIFPSGSESGPWVFVEDLIPHIPSSVIIAPHIVLVDSTRKLIYLSDIGGRQLIKVMYFRILRQFPRTMWDSFRAAPMDELGSVDFSYDLVLTKLDPIWTIQLNLQFADLCLVKPYLYIVGGLANRGASKNDVDVLLRAGCSPELERTAFSKFVEAFPSQLKERFSKVEDSGLGPYTSYLGIMSLDLVHSKEAGA